MSKEMLKGLIDLIPEEDIETVYKVILKFIPETEALPDEVAAIMEAKAEKGPLIPHKDVQWD